MLKESAKKMETQPMASPKSPPGGAKRQFKKSVTYADFQPDPTQNEVERAAAFLDWAAQNMPKRFIPYTWITKHAKPNMHRVPDVGSLDVAFIRKKIGSIKRVLWDVYGRKTDPAPRSDEIPGVRATTDTDDIAGTDFLRTKKRVHNGILHLQDTRSKMDIKSMRDKGLKSMVTSMDPVIKQLTDGDLMAKLKELPARTDDDEDDDKKGGKKG
jgi:hypothetical protein